jgi:magnesium chelatase family protein
MTSRECDQLLCASDAHTFIATVVTHSPLSGRGYYRLLKTAQTIADLEKAPMIGEAHIAEAFGYRLRDE